MAVVWGNAFWGELADSPPFPDSLPDHPDSMPPVPDAGKNPSRSHPVPGQDHGRCPILTILGIDYRDYPQTEALSGQGLTRFGPV